MTEPDILLQRMQDFLFLVWDVVDKPDSVEIPETMEEVMHELDEALMQLAIAHTDMKDENAMLKTDLLAYSVTNMALRADLMQATKLVVALTSPPTNEMLLNRATNVLQREGDAELSVQSNGNDIDVHITFNSEKELREGLRAAIEDYNVELSNKLLTGP